MGCCLPLSPTNIPNSVLDVEFKIPDACGECETNMTDAISKFKGVASYVTDAKKQKIVVTGSFNEEKLLKKLMKVTGVKVEIVVKNEKNDEPEIVQKSDDIIAEKTEESEIVEKVEKSEMVPEEVAKAMEPNTDEQKELEKIMMFSEENPNTRCSIS